MNMPFTLIAGPCVIESVDLVMQVAEAMKADLPTVLAFATSSKPALIRPTAARAIAFAAQDDKGLEVLRSGQTAIGFACAD